MTEILVLDHDTISLKLDRMAWQILENNYQEKSITLIGIIDRGVHVAQNIKERLENNGTLAVNLITASVNKEDALNSNIQISDRSAIANTVSILVDDVLNSGSTMAAVLAEVLNHHPKQVSTAVLANRDNNKFPIQANYVGISLATTVQEHISYKEIDGKMSVWLT